MIGDERGEPKKNGPKLVFHAFSQDLGCDRRETPLLLPGHTGAHLCSVEAVTNHLRLRGAVWRLPRPPSHGRLGSGTPRAPSAPQRSLDGPD